MVNVHYERVGKCEKCGKCCKSLKIKLDARITGDVAEYFRVRGLQVDIGPKWTILTIPNYPCPKLGIDNSCTLHARGTKPLVCILAPEKKWQLIENCGYSLKEIK